MSAILPRLFHNELANIGLWTIVGCCAGAVLCLAVILFSEWRHPISQDIEAQHDDHLDVGDQMFWGQTFASRSALTPLSPLWFGYPEDAPPIEALPPETALTWPAVPSGLNKTGTLVFDYINELHELIKDLQEQIDELNEDK